MIIHIWISSDGSELVPTTDVKINLTLPYISYKFVEEDHLFDLLFEAQMHTKQALTIL
jgi:hypothetical protein